MLWSYQWRGINANGKKVCGIKNGRLKKLKQSLVEQEIYVLSIRPVLRRPQSPVTTKQLLLFIEQLQNLLSAGIALDQALQLMASSHRDKKFIELCQSTASKIQQGETLAKALAHFDPGINPVYSQMIAAGEHSGSLLAMLDHCKKNPRKISRTQIQYHKSVKLPDFCFNYGAAIVAWIIDLYRAEIL